jgi:starch-binding outer membrane protein, SusD/RagB family
VLLTVTDEDQTLFPIPLSEMLTNTNPGMYQNPGY